MKSYNQLSNKDKESIKDLYYKNHSFGYISKELEVSKRSISRVLRDFGINTRLKNRYTLNESYFTFPITQPSAAYLLGLLAADGCVTSNNQIILQLIDKELIDFLVQEIAYTGDIRVLDGDKLSPPGQTAYRVNFSSLTMSKELRKAGIMAGKDYLSLPSEEILSLGLLPDFIRGYLDGDGCIYLSKKESGGSISIVGSKSFCESLVSFFNFGTVTSHKSGMFYWKIYGKKHFLLFREILYGKDPVCFLKRKKDLLDYLLENYKYENCWKTQT